MPPFLKKKYYSNIQEIRYMDYGLPIANCDLNEMLVKGKKWISWNILNKRILFVNMRSYFGWYSRIERTAKNFFKRLKLFKCLKLFNLLKRRSKFTASNNTAYYQNWCYLILQNAQYALVNRLKVTSKYAGMLHIWHTK